METTVLSAPASIQAETNPFKGAQSYDKSDRDSFYGRDKDLNELMRNVEQYTLSLLYSRSGVGKTSLVKAGLIPVLEEIKKFFPVYIRISDNLITKEITSFSEAVVKLTKDAAQARSIRVKSDENNR